MQSVQLSAQIKFVEVWKIVNVKGHPLVMNPYTNSTDKSSNIKLRPQPTRVFDDTFKLQRSGSSFCTDAARLWNLSPPEIRTATTLTAAKSAISKYVTSLPV